MAKKKHLLERMRDNPRADWSIKDVEKLCNEVGLTLAPPSRGSHYRVFSEHLRDPLVIPARRPIKPPYVRLLVSHADAHISFGENDDGPND